MKSGVMNPNKLRRAIIMMAIWGVVWLVIVVLADWQAVAWRVQYEEQGK